MAKALKKASKSNLGSMGSRITGSEVSIKSVRPSQRLVNGGIPRPAASGTSDIPESWPLGAGLLILAYSDLALFIRLCLCSYSCCAAAALLVAVIFL